MKHTEETKVVLPENFAELQKQATRKADWRERFDAVEELGRCQKSKPVIDLLLRTLKNDAVFKVQEAAYLQLKAMGEKVEAPVRSNKELIKDTKKVLLRIKKSLPADHTYEDFKEKVRKTRSDLFDTYEGDKGAKFDEWLEGMWASFSVR